MATCKNLKVMCFWFSNYHFSRFQLTSFLLLKNNCKKNLTISCAGRPNNYNVKKMHTNFGFESIPENQKQAKVNDVFTNVAKNYDIMNDVMSIGIHRLWKDYFVSLIPKKNEGLLLDMAGGTGDISFRYLRKLEDLDGVKCQTHKSTNKSSSKKSNVTVCDINSSMIDVGKERANKLGYSDKISWVCANAESLPFEDETFDIYTIAYGIRNTTHIDLVLKEAFRVLRRGGHFMCLEFSHLSNPIFQYLYDRYSFQIIPVMGQIVANDWKSYQYLVESIRRFPSQSNFVKLIQNAGFKCVVYENISYGVSAIHSGIKL